MVVAGVFSSWAAFSVSCRLRRCLSCSLLEKPAAQIQYDAYEYKDTRRIIIKCVVMLQTGRERGIVGYGGAHDKSLAGEIGGRIEKVSLKVLEVRLMS